MKKYSREQLKKRLIVCTVLGVITGVVLGIGNAVMGALPLGAGALLALGAIVIFPIELFGMTFNFGKMLLGMIAPIPILSMFIEIFKSYVYAIKGIIVIVKKQDYLTIGKKEETDA